MEEALTCDVCSEEYREGSHDPIILHCGHTFCRSCIMIIRRTDQHSCPTCREKIKDGDFESLAVNFAILSIANRMVDYKPKSCPAHKKLLDLWCSKCQVVICGLCIANDHRDESHTIILAEDHVAEVVKKIDGSCKEVKQLISKAQSTLYHNTKEILVSLLDVYRDQSHIDHQNTMNTVITNTRSLLRSVEGANGYLARLQSIEASVTKILEDRTSQKEETTEDSPSQKVETTEDRTSQKGETTEDRTSQKVETTEDKIIENESEKLVIEKETSHEEVQRMACLPNMEVPLPLTITIRDDVNRYAILFWKDKKLLLSAFQNKPIKSLFTIQWNLFETLLPTEQPEAFMELSYRSNYLGVVYIRLWGHLRRAQHFLALCLGSQGPSYKGGAFRSKHKEVDKDRLCGCDYRDVTGIMTTRGLMADLEWSGEYAGKAAEGLVVGTSSGQREMDALFSIYTRVDQTAKCYCPFGNVSSGLEVVRKALDCDDPREVTVRRCGVVVPLSALKQL